MSRRNRRKASNGNLGYIVGGVFLLALVAAGVGAGVYLWIKAQEVSKLDQASLCPVDGPKSITTVLLDVTDPISRTTELDLKLQFEKAVKAVPMGGLIQVYSLTEKAGELLKSFSGCNPGNRENANEWISNGTLMQRRWETAFEKPLKSLSDHMTLGQSAKQSPIMAAIQNINLTTFGSASETVEKHLIIASDMIEHTDVFSNYKNGTDFAAFQKSEGRAKYRTSLNGVKVTLWRFQRPLPQFDGQQLDEFWAKWVMANNGTFDASIRLEGLEK